ncbi:MAG: hypothetical protein IT307_13705 [Chloroflexi bacterium]|nr:hypothetical protein [Chloroflexota bacterium]
MRLLRRLARPLAALATLGMLLPTFQMERVRAGADICPEPNDDFAHACRLSPNSPAPGFLDSASDVDVYRIEVPGPAKIRAALTRPPGDFSVRIVGGDGADKGFGNGPGTADKAAVGDVGPGASFVIVYSERGASSASAPYLLTFELAPVLADPGVPPPGDAPVRAQQAYAPGPARNYSLIRPDLPDGYRQEAVDESDDGREYISLLVAEDAVDLGQGVWFTPSRVSAVQHALRVEPYGDNDLTAAFFSLVLERLRTNYGANVQPAVGWGADEVHSYAWAFDPPDGRIYFRGIAMRHKNVISTLEILGKEQYATWDVLSRLNRIVEARILAATVGVDP